ncbi:MAG: DUF5011 domain-containing protein [Actinomycetia bacterium]|nr:DUF5011 domain-containing protein [Actinomycetes bacterium]
MFVAVSMVFTIAVPSGLFAGPGFAPSADLAEYSTGSATSIIAANNAAQPSSTSQPQKASVAPTVSPVLEYFTEPPVSATEVGNATPPNNTGQSQGADTAPTADSAFVDYPAVLPYQPEQPDQPEQPEQPDQPVQPEQPIPFDQFEQPYQDDQPSPPDLSNVGLGIGIMPLSVTLLAPGVVAVDNWADLRSAIADPAVVEIRLNGSIQRTAGATTWPTDLGIVNRSLTIDGQGHSLDFRAGGAATAIVRPGFYLAYQGAGAFTLKNIDIIRPNGGEDSLVEIANSAGSAVTEPTDLLNSAAAATSSPTTGSGWTVNFSNINTSVAPSSGLVLVPAGTVNFTGNVTWDCSTGSAPNNCVVFAANTTISGSGTVVTLRNHNASSTVEDMPTIRANVNGSRNSVNVTGGAQANLENMGRGLTQVISLASGDGGDSRPAGTSTFVVVSGAGTVLNANGHGAGTGPEGGTMVMVAAATTANGGGGFQITGGAKVNVHAWSPSGTTGMPAMIQQVDGGQFILDGEGTELNVIADGNNNDLAGAIRIRLVGNQTFAVSNLAKLYVLRTARNGGFRPPAIRFGPGANNNFIVTSGGTVRVENQGNGSTATTDTAAQNGAVEFDANNFTFDVSGSSTWATSGQTLSGGSYYPGMKQPSAIELIARSGAAVSGGVHTGGKISVRDNAVFVARGNVNSDTAAIFSAGSPFTFSCDNPLYYDFTNTRANGTTGTMKGGMVFHITGASSTYSIKNSNLEVWRNGRSLTANNTAGGTYDPIDNSPYKSWIRVDATFSAANFASLASTDPALAATAASFGTQGMLSYTRISGNNAKPQLTGAGSDPLTNADKYIRAVGVVPEGLNFAGRPIWDSEVKAYVQRTQANGTVTNNLLAGTSINHENVWEQEVAANNPRYSGVVRYDAGGFLTTGDSYKFTDVWRGAADNPNDPKSHHEVPPNIQGGAASAQTVLDVTPPVPGIITQVNGQAANGRFLTGQATISGTYPTEEAYNPEEPVAVRAQVVRSGQPVSGLSFDGTLNAQARLFTVEIPANVSETQLNEGDKIFILLKDANGNENPIAATPYHDALIPAGASLTVEVFPVIINGQDKVIGLNEARDILDIDRDGVATGATGSFTKGSVDANLLQLIAASGTAAPGKSPDVLSIYLASVQPPFTKASAVDQVKANNAFADFTLKVGSELQNPGPAHSNLVYAKDFSVRVIPRDNPGPPAANDFNISAANAATLMAKGATEKAAEFIQRADAVAAPNGNMDTPFDQWTSANVEFVSTTMPVSPVADTTYTATFAVKGNPTKTTTVNIYVSLGVVPMLTVTSPINIAIGSPALTTSDYMNGVRATKNQSGADITNQVANNSATNPVNTAKAGLYPVTYTVTNDDGNLTTATRLYVVNDGSYVATDPNDNVTPDYVLHARSFVVKKADASTATVNTMAEVEAWRVNIAAANGRASVAAGLTTNSKSYGAGCAVGDYPLVVAITEATGVTQAITATVVEKDVLQTAADPTTNIRYSIAANSASLLANQVSGYVGKDAAVSQKLITLAAAQGWKLTNLSEPKTVVVTDNPIPFNARSGDTYPVTFAVAESPTITCTVNVVIGGTPPVISFDEAPLVIAQQTGANAHVLTADELKLRMQVTDAEDTDSAALLTATTASVAQNQPINTRNVGVYKVSYSVTDSDNMTSTAVRAVVIDDGRYVIDKTNKVIIGARNFVVKQSQVQGTESEVRSYSWSEAYDIDGNPVALSLGPLPDGWQKNPALKDYPFTWQAQGANGVWVQKAITGTVVDADEVSPTDKDSRYTIVASNFAVNTAAATQLMASTDAAFMAADRANVHVYKLLPGIADQTALIADRGNFSAATNASPGYPIKFAIQGMLENNVTIRGTVSDGAPPVLTVPTPVEIWIGAAAALPATAILPAAWTPDGLHSVSVSDPDQPGLSTADVVVSGDTVDTAAPGLYKLHYAVTDDNGNQAQSDRIVVVNDGRYVPGVGRILLAKGFVTTVDAVSPNSANLNAEILGNSSATLYDGTTGAVIDATSVWDNGGYRKAVGVYDGIVVRGVDVPAGYIDKRITGEVVEADEIAAAPTGPNANTYYVFGNNIALRIGQVQDILAAADPGLALLTALAADGRVSSPDGSVGPVAVRLANNGNLQARPNIYRVLVSDTGNHVSVELTVTVGEGNMPTITAEPVPLNIPVTSAAGNLSEAQLLSGVKVSDAEDTAGLATDVTALSAAARSRFSYSIQDMSGANPRTVTAIPANRAGVYQVTYSYTDADANPAAPVKRALIVNDGSIIYDANYILKAKSFIIGVSEVDEMNPSDQILEKSEARSWKTDGSAATVYVAETANYGPIAGEYAPTIAINGYADLTRNIKAKVVKTGDDIGDFGYGNGDKYSIVAQNFRINIADAKALQAAGATAIGSGFVTRASATGYWRAGDQNGNFNFGGTPRLSADGGFGTAVFAEEGTAAYPSIFPVTFWVDEDHTATTTVTCIVSNGSHPWLTVPPFKQVPLGGSFNEADYVRGVTYGDSEDEVSKLTLTHDNPVDTSRDGAVYKVTYTVTDSEANKTEAIGFVLVGDWVFDGDYAVKAASFVTTVKTVQGAASKDTLTLSRSHAQARHIVRDADGNITGIETAAPTVKANGGLAAAAGTYSGIQIGVVAAAQPIATIQAQVVEKDKISNDPAANGSINDTNTSNPTDPAHYAVAANNVVLTWVEAGALVGKTDSATAATLIQKAAAEVYKADSSGIRSGAASGLSVALSANGIRQATGDYDVTFVPAGISGVAVTVTFSVDQGTMPVIIAGPKEVAKADTPTGMTRSELLDGVTVTDAESPEVGPADAVITLKDSAGNSIAAIDKSKPGVYQATYTVADPFITNPDGTPATSQASRAIVVNDGRFLLTDEDGDGKADVIVGAKSFVVSAEDPTFSGSTADALRLSRAEAYDATGAALVPVLVDAVTGQAVEVPVGFAAKQPGTYNFAVSAAGHPNAQCAQVSGAVVFDGSDDGEDHIVIDQGPDPYSSPYALWARDFTLDVADAADLAASDAGLITAADAHVVKLVPSAPDASPSVIDRDGITNRKGEHNPRFGISGHAANEYSVTVDAVINDAAGPVLTVTTPYEVAPGTPWERSTAMNGVSASDPGDGDLTDQVTYYPTPDPADPDGPAKPVDTAKPGIYLVTYQVSDSDADPDDADGPHTVTADRVVVVNDGRYMVGKNSVLEAASFVIKVADVTNDATQVSDQLKTMSGARAYNGTTGDQLAPESISVDSAGGYGPTTGTYDITFSLTDGVTDGVAGRITKTVKAKVVDAQVLDNRPLNPDDPDGARTYVYGNNIQLRISEAARLLAGGDPTILAALGTGAFRTNPANSQGELVAQGVKVTDHGDFKAAPGTYTLKVADLGSICEIPLAITVVTGNAPTITPEKPVKVPISADPRGLTPSEIKGKATASDSEDGNLTDKIQVAGNVPANVAGIYPVTLSVTDSDGNTVAVKSSVVVDDGSFIYGRNYILHASDFTVAASAVSASGSAAQIASLSGAYAADYDGLPAAVSVTSLGGYTKARGSYTPTVAVTAEPATAKRITATVTSPLISYRVTFNASGGALTGPARVWVVEPATTLGNMPSAPLRSGYTFIGWYTQRVGGSQFTADAPVRANRTLYAHWQANPVAPLPQPNNYYTTNYYGGPTTVADDTGGPTYLTVTNPVTPTDGGGVIGDPLTPTANSDGHWSIYNLCAAVLALLLLVAFLIMFILGRRKASQGAQDSNRQTNYHVSGPVLLIAAAAFIEVLIVLLSTQDFTAQRVVFDVFSAVVTLAVLVQLLAPVIGALLLRRKREEERPAEPTGQVERASAPA